MRIVFSVLNRLVADTPLSGTPGVVVAAAGRVRPPAGIGKGEFERYRAAVRNDLVWLLNTRRIADLIPENLREVEKSVYCYGIPDFAALNLNAGTNEGDQDRLAGIIARVIELFEPRILNVRVTTDKRSSSSRDLHFQVYGRLKMKPRPEPVCYDTMLDVTRGEYNVEVLDKGRA